MRNKEIVRLVAGYRRFREKYFFTENSVYGKLSTRGQSPKTLIIGCSDSRVDPAILSSASPGELFVVRNVANLVPPYETGGVHHGVSAAIEFAVVSLKVETIVILGHRQCGGIRALMAGDASEKTTFIGNWVKIAIKARDKVLLDYPEMTFEKDEEILCRHCEKEAIVVSLENLQTFPFIQEAIREKRLDLHGVYFDLESGELLQYSENDRTFLQLPV